ncbi:MAG: HAD-IIA family hydrolase [Chloroflexota bacterium]|nr:HAD-IIA family hydrolase [Chloroflexota bacterium]
MQSSFLLASFRYVIMDMDGVLYRADSAQPGLKEFFDFLERTQLKYLLITNNSTLSAEDYSQKLLRMGVTVPATSIVTSGQAAAAYVQKEAPEGCGIFVVGMKSLRDALFEDQRYYFDAKNPRFVVQGGDFNLVYDTVKRACLLIRAGAKFIAANADPVFPTEEGLVPGSGSIGALLQVSSGQAPLVIGKPEPAMYELALEKLGADREKTVMIGDNLLTDIEGANRLGISSILTLSGVTSAAEYEQSTIKANMAFKGLPELIEVWEAALLESTS